MVNHVARKRYQKTQIIFSQGQEADCAYIIEQGSIRIEVDDGNKKNILAYLKEGEIFGEMAIIDGLARTASAIVEEDCLLTVIPKAQIEDRIQRADSVVKFLVLMLMNRVRNTLEHNNSQTPDILNIRELGIKIDEQTKTGYETTDVKSQVLEKIKLESELLDGISQGQFKMYFQPIIELRSGDVTGFEALVRWFHPTRGMVRPDHFIPVAEETSLIIPLGEWILRETCERTVQFLELTDNPDFFVSVNISGKQLVSSSFIPMLTSVTQMTGVAPRNLKLEITEGVMIEKKMSEVTLNQCRNLGFKLALDDFGTGYSGLRYLKDFVVDTVKLDKSFVQQLLVNRKAAVMVESIINLANGLNIPVIAEGIEKEEQLNLLKTYRCHFGQGYYYSKPVAFEDAVAILSKSAFAKKKAA